MGAPAEAESVKAFVGLRGRMEQGVPPPSLGPRDKWTPDMNFWILREEKVGDQDS